MRRRDRAGLLTAAGQTRGPVVWSRSLAELLDASDLASASTKTDGAPVEALFGLVRAPREPLAAKVRLLMQEHQTCKVMLVLGLYPTCATAPDDLRGLWSLSEEFKGRCSMRLTAECSSADRPGNLVVVRAANATLVYVGASENLGLGEQGSTTQPDLLLKADPAVVGACMRWFDRLWDQSGPLNELTIDVPRLVLPAGDASAAETWHRYRVACSPSEESVENPAASGAVEPGPPLEQLVTAQLGASLPDTLTEEVARLFATGFLVTIDKSTRIPPLSAPVRPEWFGVPAFQQVGGTEATVNIRVSPFDDAGQRRLDRMRKAPSELLPRFSFPLADGVRWIPSGAVELFESQLQIAGAQVSDAIADEVGDNIGGFLARQHDRIRGEATRIYATFNPGATFPESSVEAILAELTARLEKVLGGQLLPKASYASVSFEPMQGMWKSSWAQAYQLLKGVAELPRKEATSNYFWHGLREVDREVYLRAMIVVPERALDQPLRGLPRQRAVDELGLIRSLDGTGGDLKEKCAALWALLGADDARPLEALVTGPQPQVGDGSSCS